MSVKLWNPVWCQLKHRDTANLFFIITAASLKTLRSNGYDVPEQEILPSRWRRPPFISYFCKSQMYIFT